jgi:uncharacterized protein YndB with AHSA1/START domain
VDASVPRPPGTAPRVQLTAPPELVWAALTEPHRVAQWFGDLDAPLLIGRENRLDFGDGDFFTLLPVRMERPALVAWEWRFLGIEDPARIEWTLTPRDNGTEVRVRHLEAGGNETARAELLEGWQDFLSRLARHLRSGRPSRYTLRDRIDGAVALAAGRFRPLREPDLFGWLPVATDGFVPRWFFIVDAEGPRRFAVTDWHLTPDVALSCRIEIPGAAVPTDCSVLSRGGPDGLHLEFVHDGWTRLGLPDRGSMLLRRQFAATWIASLQSARDLAAAPAAAGGAPDGAA